MPDPTHVHVYEDGKADAAYTLLLLHGTGADERDLLPLGRFCAPGIPLLSPLGKVREHGMPRWFRRHAEGVFDEDDLRARAADLAAFVRSPDAGDADRPRRHVALGFSNGANIAAALLLLHADTLAGAVLLRAMPPLVPETLPDLDGVPVLIAAGTHDHLIPPDGTDRLAAMLKDAGASVTVRWADAGHALAPDEPAMVRDWLATRV